MVCIAMEFAPYGDLQMCVKEPLPEDQVREIVRQVTTAVRILHKKDFAHRDLKPKVRKGLEKLRAY